MFLNPGLPGGNTQIGLNVNSPETAVWIYVKVHARVPGLSPGLHQNLFKMFSFSFLIGKIMSHPGRFRMGQNERKVFLIS